MNPTPDQTPAAFTPRPKPSDQAIVRQAAEALAPKVLEWTWETFEDEKERRHALLGITEDLEKELRYRTDGYELARALDGKYDADAQLVEILDEAFGLIQQHLGKAQKEWVKANPGVMESVPPGSWVRWRKNPGFGRGLADTTHEQGLVRVVFPDKGQSIVRPFKGCYLVPAEELEISPAEDAARAE